MKEVTLAVITTLVVLAIVTNVPMVKEVGKYIVGGR